MKKILLLALGMSSALLAQAATNVANPFQHTFVEAELFDMRNDNLDNESNVRLREAGVDGLRFKGSFALNPDFSVIGSLSDAGDSRYDITVFSVGASYHQALPSIEDMPFEFVIRAEIEQVEIDVDDRRVLGNADDSQTGVVLGGGVQLGVLYNLQVFSDFAMSSNDYREYALSAGVRYEFMPNLSGISSVEVGDATTVALGLRYHF